MASDKRCKCKMSISVLGDGCRYCQPQEYIDRMLEQIKDEAAPQPNAAVAAIQFALETDCGKEFLHCWAHGEFDAIRQEWPEAPDNVFIGADPLYKEKTDGE